MAGSSRGNVGELLGEHHGRRRVAKFAASNSMHSEIAAAVSIELGIHGGWQMLSNGCSSGLDALGFAAGLVAAGMAPRAVVVSVDLPLIPALLADFPPPACSTDGVNDPYSTSTTGFLPAEGGAAILVEPLGTRPAMALVHGYWVDFRRLGRRRPSKRWRADPGSHRPSLGKSIRKEHRPLPSRQWHRPAWPRRARRPERSLSSGRNAAPRST